MKNILLTVALSLLLLGCSLTAQKYDNNEYKMLVHFVVSIEEVKAQCSEDGSFVRSSLPALRFNARMIEKYSEYTPDNPEVQLVSKILRDDIDQLIAFYDKNKHNKTYCRIKTDLILRKAERILEAVGKKKRD